MLPAPARRIPRRSGRLTVLPVLLALVVVLLVVNLVVVLGRDPRPLLTKTDQFGALPVGPPESTRPAPVIGPEPGQKATVTPRFGVFVGTDPQAVHAFSTWLGRPVRDVVDFSHRDSWAAIADPDYVLDGWRGTRYRLVYGVPLLPDTLEATRDDAMRRGADGAYDPYFEELATHLVAAGQDDAVLRIGWEFNLKSWAWGINDDRVFVQYFRRVVNVMRSVPGQHFDIDWNPNNGFNPYDAVSYWPGNAFVDSVGIDAYDVDRHRYPYPRRCSLTCREQHQQNAWDEVIFGGPRGLSFWSAFAQRHGKPFALPEWSMWDRFDGTGGGDDPLFLNQMHYFINAPANGVSFAAYFNLNGQDGHHVLQKYFPAGAKRFQQLFGPEPAETPFASGSMQGAGQYQ